MRARGIYRYFGAAPRGTACSSSEVTAGRSGHFDFPRQRGWTGSASPTSSGRWHAASATRSRCSSSPAARGSGDAPTELKEKGEYVLSHALQAVAIEAAEAAAERLHREIREQWWELPDAPELTMTDRFKAKYQGHPRQLRLSGLPEPRRPEAALRPAHARRDRRAAHRRRHDGSRGERQRAGLPPPQAGYFNVGSDEA